ncbi:hypothetical protein F5Y14DRAFT_454432 [Nemania sp. NC0429]|nr:hypothetical protein F5Y14DRAFT_454432 [Nemania sp. NC0429]
MSSRESSISSGSGYPPVVTQNKFRSHKSKDYQGDRIVRQTSTGGHVVTYNHYARGFDQDVPTPRYSDSSAYKKTQK